jgi:two-component system, chemotaxis family, sensor kinase CheA
MDNKNEEFLKRLRATFHIEAEEHVRAISAGLIELEKEQGPEKRAQGLETIFRETHSLKGAARSVGLDGIESMCQPMESIFAALKRQEISLNPVLYDLLHQTTDSIMQLVAETGEENATAFRLRNRELVRQLNDITAKNAKVDKKEIPKLLMAECPDEDARPQTDEKNRATVQETVEKPVVMAETVRIPTAKLDPLLLQAEEMITIKTTAKQRVKELQEINSALTIWKTESEKWKARKSNAPTWEELWAWNETRLNTLQSRAAVVARAAEQDQRLVSRLVDEHLETVKNVLMLPVGTLVEVFPRLVRDLARSQDKEVELIVYGTEIEIDKRILEELKDPLIHLIRNCVDHGIEKPEERTQEGKPSCGTIKLTFTAKESRRMEISVSDDGAGIALDKVKAAVSKLGLFTVDTVKQVSPQDAMEFIFHSGVSTSPIITDISGRGLGLAIVREKVEKLGGVVSVESVKDAGATFRIVIPMTLATFRGVIVRTGDSLFVAPSINLERVLRVSEDDIKTVENRETISIDGIILPLARLSDTLEMPVRKNVSTPFKIPGLTEVKRIPVIVLTSMDNHIGFLVDEVLQEQEVLVKGLGAQLQRVRNIAGATVTGTGKIVPVLNVSDLIKSAVRLAAAPRKETAYRKTSDSAEKILVAEDSITSRTLLKNILETAGFQVTTAVDGADALAQLHSNEFGLVVSDVDMPRMNGFELTAKIRADKKLGETPVVLVTSLESRDDKERGIEAGANAYIVKSSFDQSNLLEVVRRFL